jgi:hypothetical protein
LCGRCNYLSSSTVALDFSPLPNSWKEEIYMCIKNALTFELQFINDFPIKQKGQIYIRCFEGRGTHRNITTRLSLMQKCKRLK